MTLFAGRAGGRMAARMAGMERETTLCERIIVTGIGCGRGRGKRAPPPNPHAANRNRAAVSRHPNPYRRLREKIDRRGLGEVLRRAAHLADAIAAPQDLREHLIVEDEIVGVVRERKLEQHLARERPIPV
jgi:hypothetical protein